MQQLNMKNVWAAAFVWKNAPESQLPHIDRRKIEN
jgi:hypothetical protein